MFLFFLGWASKKNKPNRRAQGLCFLLLWCFHTKKKSNRRAQGLWFCFFWGCKKTNPIEGHKGCVFAFLVLSEKTNPIGGHKGCVFGFCGASKKKQIQYEGRDWRERLLERNKQSTCRRFASGSSLRFVRFGSLFYTLAVRFGSVSQLPVSGRFPVRAVRFPVRGSVPALSCNSQKSQSPTLPQKLLKEILPHNKARASLRNASSGIASERALMHRFRTRLLTIIIIIIIIIIVIVIVIVIIIIFFIIIIVIVIVIVIVVITIIIIIIIIRGSSYIKCNKI